MPAEEKKFISHKELAGAYETDPRIFKREIKRIKGLDVKPYQRFYNPKHLKIIFAAFGNPFIE